jgi:uncharacterized membrane protein
MNRIIFIEVGSMQTPDFRRKLRQEANLWQQDGLIDQDFYVRLADRYQFDRIEDEAGNRFVTILTGLGCVLIGLGVLSFVAANWQYLDKTWRIVVILTALVAINTTGFYLWRQPAITRLGNNQRRFGEGFLLLGALLFGANIALLAQLFHIGGEVGVLFMGWSIGVLIMAYLLQMASLGVFSIVLMGLGYWSFAFNQGVLASIPSWAQLLYEHMPIFAAASFGLLAYRCKSLPVFGLSTIAWLTALQFAGVSYTFRFYDYDKTPVKLLAIAVVCGLPPLCLWAIGKLQKDLSLPLQRFAGWSQRLAVFSAGLTCFCLSLDYFLVEILRLNAKNRILLLDWQIDRTLFIIVAVVLWGLLWQQRSRLGWTLIDTGLLLLGVVTTGLILLVGTINNPQLAHFAPSIFFILLAAITFGCIRAGLMSANRGAFYFGWLLLTIRILTWFAFTQTDLMLKSLLFVLAGAATIAVGLWFERQLRQSRPVNLIT